MRIMQPETEREERDAVFATAWLRAANPPALRYLPRHDISRKGIDGLRGAEILLDYGPVTPAAPNTTNLVAALERTGHGPSLDALVLDRALKEATLRHREGLPSLTVSINIGADTLCLPNFSDRLTTTVDALGLPPGSIAFELTERQPIRNMERAIHAVQHLANAGIPTILDDFGTGHSGPDWLTQLPVSGVKISRETLLQTECDHRMDRHIADLTTAAREAGLSVTVEGIETVQQASRAMAWGATDGQGWLYSRPIPPRVYAGRVATLCMLRASSRHAQNTVTSLDPMPVPASAASALRAAAARQAALWASAR